MGNNCKNLNTLICRDPFQKKLQPVHRSWNTALRLERLWNPQRGSPLPSGLPSQWAVLQEPGVAWGAGPSSATPARLWGRWFHCPPPQCWPPSPSRVGRWGVQRTYQACEKGAQWALCQPVLHAAQLSLTRHVSSSFVGGQGLEWEGVCSGMIGVLSIPPLDRGVVSKGKPMLKDQESSGQRSLVHLEELVLGPWQQKFWGQGHSEMASSDRGLGRPWV